MLIDRVTHQKSGKPERTETRQGETLQGIGRDEAGLAQHEPEGLGRTDLLTQVVARANMVLAWKRVKANRGSAGVDDKDYFDSMKKTIAATAELWENVRETVNERILDGMNKTNYELKWAAQGRPLYYVELKKR